MSILKIRTNIIKIDFIMYLILFVIKNQYSIKKIVKVKNRIFA